MRNEDTAADHTLGAGLSDFERTTGGMVTMVGGNGGDDIGKRHRLDDPRTPR